MGLSGKIVAVKAVKGREEYKKEVATEETAKTEREKVV